MGPGNGRGDGFEEFIPLGLSVGAFLLFVVAAQFYGSTVTSWIIPGLIFGISAARGEEGGGFAS